MYAKLFATVHAAVSASYSKKLQLANMSVTAGKCIIRSFSLQNLH